ncbi:hypothetical protein Tco_1324121, partial [Tanacetum coccineum]
SKDLSRVGSDNSIKLSLDIQGKYKTQIPDGILWREILAGTFFIYVAAVWDQSEVQLNVNKMPSSFVSLEMAVIDKQGHCRHDLISLETNIGGPFLGLLEIVAVLFTANAKNIGVARSTARLKSVFGQLALDMIND